MKANQGSPAMISARIVLPCYNEARRLTPEPFRNYLKDRPSARLLFVDDGSDDETPAVLEKIKEASPAGQVEIMRLGHNQGKAEAVRQGVLKAVSDGQVDAIGYLDSDLATPLEELDALLRVLESGEAEIALGSRMAMLGRRIERRPVRHYMGRVFATLASMTLELPVYDTQCGAKVFRRHPDLKKLFEKPFDVNWTFDVEILARLKIAGSFAERPFPDCVVEVPLRRWTHKDGSKVCPLDFLVSLLELAKIWKRLKDRRE